MHRREFLVSVTALTLTGCLHGSGGGTEDGEGDEEPDISITSPNFEDGEQIPSSFTCEGVNASPALVIRNVPEEAESLAVIVDDPDAPDGTFVHWLLWNVPADTEEIPRAVSQGETVEDIDGGIQGTNDADEVGYSGPCPPEGDGPHTYRFTVYAVEGEIEIDAGATRDRLDEALDGRTVAQARLEGTYER